MEYPWHKSAFESVLARRAQLPHALLLRGARGIGKLAFAEALAAALLCAKPANNGAACGACARNREARPPGTRVNRPLKKKKRRSPRSPWNKRGASLISSMSRAIAAGTR